MVFGGGHSPQGAPSWDLLTDSALSPVQHPTPCPHPSRPSCVWVPEPARYFTSLCLCIWGCLSRTYPRLSTLPSPTPHHMQTYPSFKTQLKAALPGSLSQSSTPPAQVARTPALSACASNLKPRNTSGPHLSVSLSGLDSQLPSSCLAPMGSQHVC